MPFAIPALSDLVERSRQAFRSYLPGSDAWVWPNNLGPSAKVIAGAVFEVFGFADYIQKQKFALTADGENLVLHGAELGIAKKPAQPASGNVLIATSDAIAVAPAALFTRTDGIQFLAVTAAAIGGAGTLAVVVDAAIDGQTTTTLANTPLAITSGVTGPGASTALAAVDGNGLVGGADIEPDGDPFTSDLATFRGRILFRKRNPPFGGDPADYVMWALSVSGVTRVFVERVWSGAGTVRVFPLMDDLYPLTNGIPASGDIARVADYLETVAPSDALVTVQAPIPVTVNHIISGLTPNTVTVQEAVKAELRASFRRLSKVAGSSNPHPSMPYLATPQSWSMQWSWAALNNAAGEQRAVLVAPIADTALMSGQIPVLGTVTFV